MRPTRPRALLRPSASSLAFASLLTAILICPAAASDYPAQIGGRNRGWRRVVIDAIRGDPAWRGGDYTEQPPSLRTAAEMLWLMSSNPILRQQEAPTLAGADEAIDSFVARFVKTSDANDVLYALEASRDYDPGPALERISAPLVAVNSADDLINPPELGVMEREIQRVPRGRFVLLPTSERTRGHGTHTLAALWKQHLVALLRESEPAAATATGAAR